MSDGDTEMDPGMYRRFSRGEVASLAQRAIDSMQVGDDEDSRDVIAQVLVWAKLGRVVFGLNQEIGRGGRYGLGLPGIEQSAADRIIDKFIECVYRLAEVER